MTLPAEIVRALDLAPGTQLDWTIGPDHTLIATPVLNREQRAAALMGAGRMYLRPGSNLMRDLVEERLQGDVEACRLLDAARTVIFTRRRTTPTTRRFRSAEKLKLIGMGIKPAIRRHYTEFC